MSIKSYFVIAVVMLGSSMVHASLRMNEVQATGTHNSYHLKSPSSAAVKAWNYDQAPLAQQLAEGVRQLELDIHLKDDGLFYVHHEERIDEKSTCRLLTECLEQIHAWSKANPTHVPVLIWFELKDKDFDRILPHWKTIAPHLRELESVVSEYFSKDELVTPDLVRGEFANLPDAIRVRGWPELDSVRGRVAFALLGSKGDYRSYYGQPVDLANRIFFADARGDAKGPYAALFKPSDPKAEFDSIRRWVHEGYIVTVIADEPQNSAKTAEKRAHFALESGAQFLSTNFQRSDLKGYRFNYLPNPICNPVLAAANCEVSENLGSAPR